MERLTSATEGTFSAHGAVTRESGIATSERSSFGRPDRGFEVLKKEIFQFSASNIGQEKAKAHDRRPGFLVLEAPLGKLLEGNRNVKALSADGVVGAALSFITLAVVSLTYVALKTGDILFSPPDITALFAGIGAGFLFWTVIAVVFVLVMMAISKEL